MNEREIMTLMDGISYGWLDKQGIIHNIVDNTFSRNYVLQSPDKVLVNKVGVCWDQVELERYYFEKTNLVFKTYFIVYYDDDNCPTHTFLIFKKNNKLYWFERSWEKYKGIHEYNSINELLMDVKKRFISNQLNGLYKEMNLIIYEYSKPRYGIGVLDFYKHCEKGKVIEVKQ